ncbi:hypothetical protein, partial [Nocardioides sp. GCM10030258]|uniref:hypothetical protein n=1 Tax=Nocardioides sp. GCM10030258 TaxID=3273409 RepID=UPI00361A1FFE
MMWNDRYDDVSNWPAMLVMMVLFWGLLAVGVVLAVRWLRDSVQVSDRESDPRRILDERLARGEIDVAEHARSLAALAPRRNVARP